MNALDPAEALRLAAFIERLLAPLPDAAHSGIARALLASRRPFARDDLGFLRRMVCEPSAGADDYKRLTALVGWAQAVDV